MSGILLPLAMAGKTPWSWSMTVGDGTTYWGYSNPLGTGSTSPDDPPANENGEVVFMISTNDNDVVFGIELFSGNAPQDLFSALIVSGGNGSSAYATADAVDFTQNGSLSSWHWGDGNNKVWDSGDIGLTFTQAVTF